jgi:hypothetical protein
MRFLLLILLFPFLSVAQTKSTMQVGANGVGSQTDTSSLSNRINQKLNVSDTSGMLSGYQRAGQSSGTSQISVPSQRYNIQVDSAKYITAPVIVQDEDAGWIYMFYNLAGCHVCNGKMYMQKSRDGQVWSDPVQPIINGSVVNDVGLISVGIGNNNRIILRYQSGPQTGTSSPDPIVYDSIFTTVSDDYGDTWSTKTSLYLRGTQTEIAPYGPPIQIKGDTIYSPMYANFGVDTAQAYYDISYDNGETWADYYIIMKGLAAGTFPTASDNSFAGLNTVAESARLSLSMVQRFYWSMDQCGCYSG